MLRITLVSMLLVASAPAVLAQQGKTTTSGKTATKAPTTTNTPPAPTFDYVVGSTNNRVAGARMADAIFSKAVQSLGSETVDASLRLTSKQSSEIAAVQNRHREAAATFLTKNQKQITASLKTLGYKADFSAVKSNPDRVLADINRIVITSRKPAFTPAQAMAAVSHEPARREALRNLRVLMSKAPCSTTARAETAKILTGQQKQWLTNSLRERVSGSATARAQNNRTATQRGGKSAGAKERD